MDLDQIVVVSPETVFQEVEGESVLLNLAQARYYGLDEVGTRIWQLLQEHGSARAVFDRMLQEFAVEPERLEADLEHLLRDLQNNGLVTMASARE